MNKQEFVEFSRGIDLTDRRLLNIDQFRAYAGDLQDSVARKFLETNVSLVKRFGNKVFVDRILFDNWCNENVADINNEYYSGNSFPRCSKRGGRC